MLVLVLVVAWMGVGLHLRVAKHTGVGHTESKEVVTNFRRSLSIGSVPEQAAKYQL